MHSENPCILHKYGDAPPKVKFPPIFSRLTYWDKQANKSGNISKKIFLPSIFFLYLSRKIKVIASFPFHKHTFWQDCNLVNSTLKET